MWVGRCKPDSVIGIAAERRSFICATITRTSPPPCRSTAGYGRAALVLLCLAPHGVYPASFITVGAVSFYLAFSPLPPAAEASKGGLFSVTLSVAAAFANSPRRLRAARCPVVSGLSSRPRCTEAHPTSDRPRPTRRALPPMVCCRKVIPSILDGADNLLSASATQVVRVVHGGIDPKHGLQIPMAPHATSRLHGGSFPSELRGRSSQFRNSAVVLVPRPILFTLHRACASITHSPCRPGWSVGFSRNCGKNATAFEPFDTSRGAPKHDRPGLRMLT
jgi:hypothetical protein